MNVFIFDRSNLDDIVAIIPVGHKDNPTDKALKVTRLQDLEGRGLPRADVVLFNGRTKQHALYVSWEGYSGDTWLLEILTEKQYEELEGIAARMRNNAERYECASKLIC